MSLRRGGCLYVWLSISALKKTILICTYIYIYYSDLPKPMAWLDIPRHYEVPQVIDATSVSIHTHTLSPFFSLSHIHTHTYTCTHTHTRHTDTRRLAGSFVCHLLTKYTPADICSSALTREYSAPLNSASAVWSELCTSLRSVLVSL